MLNLSQNSILWYNKTKPNNNIFSKISEKVILPGFLQLSFAVFGELPY